MKETTIVLSDGNPMATIWSGSAYFQRRMEKLGLDGTSHAGGVMYDIPKDMVKIHLPRQMTEAQREQVRNRLQMARNRARMPYKPSLV